MTSLAENFCMSPWYELRIEADGQVRYCHASRRNFDRPNDFVQWFNQDPILLQDRDGMKNGKHNPHCIVCHQQQKIGTVSFRQRRNLQAAVHQSWFEESFQQSPIQHRVQGQSTDIKPAFIHVSFSNICNMACIMCDARFSTKLSIQHKKFGLIPQDYPTVRDWTVDPLLWQRFLDLVKNNKDLLCVHVMGGEPMLHKKFLEFLSWCGENDCCDFHLTFVTNCSVDPKPLLPLLDKFQSVQVEISIETFDASNDFIRDGGSIDAILPHIQTLLQHRNERFAVFLRTVPQALSIGTYHTVIDFAIKNDLIIDCNNLVDPDFLQVRMLPSASRRTIAMDLRRRYRDILDHDTLDDSHKVNLRDQSRFLNSIKQHIWYLLNLLEQPESNDVCDLQKKFLRFLDITHKRQTFHAQFPEIILHECN